MTPSIVRRVAPLALGASAFALGCDRSADAPERADGGHVPTPIVATKLALADNEQAIRALAAARCEREARCGHVGPGARWASDALCRSELVAKGQAELGAPRCPGGIVQKELDECLREVEKEDCHDPFDALERRAACRRSGLCKAIP
jgi:hypothetical protein